MMKSNSRLFVASTLAFSVLTLASCQNAGVQGPSTKSVKGKLTFELPEYITVKTLEVHASENFGSEVDPLIKARFSADAKLSEPLYERVADYSNTDVIRVQSEQGTPIIISGKYSATMQGQTWKVSFDDLDAAPNPRGRRLSNWSVGSYVMAGTSEEKALIKKDEEEADRREKDRKIAEASRIKAEEEKKRVALAEQQKTAALQARLDKERAAARQAASAKKSAAEAAFRQSVAGTWNPIGSMIDRNGDVYANGRDKVAVSMRFSIPQSQHNKFVVPLTMYASEYPSAQFTTDATVTLDAGSNKMTLSFPGSKKIKRACLSRPKDECTYYQSLGNPWTGIIKNGEIKLIGGRNRNITLRKS